MKKRYSLAVIGAGASGLVAAITHKTAYPEHEVLLLEKMPRVGKKILATGNGRCNMTNLGAKPDDYNCPDFVSPTLSEYPPESNVDFFKKIGLFTCADSEGRVYPYSFNASSVLNCLRNECVRLGIETLTDFFVKDVMVLKNGAFCINDEIECEKLIIACGGKSSSVHGSDGSGYKLLEKLSHTITPPKPSLVQICTDSKVVRKLKGIRVRGKLTLEKNDRVCGESHGEILFTDYGISGIASLDVSMFIAREKTCSGLKIVLDMAQDHSEKELTDYILYEAESSPLSPCENALSFILPQKAGEVFVKECGIDAQKSFSDLTENDIKKLVRILKSFTLDVVGTKGFDMSQVTCGGAVTDEFSNVTLQSKKVKNLYCCGEILDVDAGCGGYNLQWAWSSGRLAGLCK